MQTKGKFMLCPVEEFGPWLEQYHCSRQIKLLQNHHTFQPGYAQFNGGNHFKLLEGMEHFHMAERGFAEIAQNLTTFPDGTVALCRSLDKVPAGIKGANQGGICMEHLGNFDAGGDAMTPEHREAIIRLNALLCDKFNLPPSPDTVVYHHWYDLNSGQKTGGTGATKSCPGTAFFGGNTVEAAKAHFLPLVTEAMAAIPSAQRSRPDSPAATMGCAEVTASSLNVRSGPGTANGVLKSLQRGVRVSIYETAGGWCRIHPSQQHWVFAQYLRPVS